MYQILIWSSTCCMWRVEKVSTWEKEKILLLCCKTHGKIMLYHFAMYHKKAHIIIFLYCVPKKSTRQSFFIVCYIFAVCAYEKKIICCVPDKKNTRQTTEHMANSQIPIVELWQTWYDMLRLLNNDLYNRLSSRLNWDEYVDIFLYRFQKYKEACIFRFRFQRRDSCFSHHLRASTTVNRVPSIWVKIG